MFGLGVSNENINFLVIFVKKKNAIYSDNLVLAI